MTEVAFLLCAFEEYHCMMICNWFVLAVQSNLWWLSLYAAVLLLFFLLFLWINELFDELLCLKCSPLYFISLCIKHLFAFRQEFIMQVNMSFYTFRLITVCIWCILDIIHSASSWHFVWCDIWRWPLVSESHFCCSRQHA